MEAQWFIAGVDLGGTKIRTLIVDPSLNATGDDQRLTLADHGSDAVIERIVDSIREAAHGRTLVAAGISTPGPCNPATGTVTEPPNLPGWHDVPLAQRVADGLGVPAWLENDANCAAIAEHRFGAGRGLDHMVLVTLGTGIGGGLILNGRLYGGTSGGAGEIGHMQLEPNGPVCGCGRRGCLEVMASGYTIEREARALCEAEPGGILATLSAGRAPSAEIVLEASESGDAGSSRIIDAAGRYLGAGLTNIVDVFNPQAIVISGNLRKLGAPYLGTARTVVEREAYRGHLRDVRIVETGLGDDAGALGACLLAFEKIGLAIDSP